MTPIKNLIGGDDDDDDGKLHDLYRSINMNCL
jgi:hypothetical protein